MTLLVLSAAISAVAFAPAVQAQEVNPALDPTLMTGWAGGEAPRQDAEQRAGKSAPRRATGDAGRSARARRICADMDFYRAKAGADDPRVRKMEAMCAMLPQQAGR